ncbi:MAG: hypothetical protein JO020_17165 [Chloroflexi bacterium]|nr:hypothetical protein [Chloroflexota bacterium]MBV9131910.1 hypothetical protein [Chloroflexota bacterium]MBV9895897.1 hypothetical protein [Chloroflexota bacterium]
MTRPPRRWPSALGGHDWGDDDRAYAALLDALTRDRVEAEALEREMSAPAHQDIADLGQLQREELEEARRELDAFRSALDNLRQRAGGSEHTEVPYDSTQPPEDAAADVLIQYLVRPGYAEVRTEEPHQGEYVYYIRVDWPKLRELAQEQGHPLP